MSWYIILFLIISLVMGGVILAFIYFGLIRGSQEDQDSPR